MDILWSGGVNNPMDSIEQLSYLIFLRLLTEKDEMLAALRPAPAGERLGVAARFEVADVREIREQRQHSQELLLFADRAPDSPGQWETWYAAIRKAMTDSMPDRKPQAIAIFDVSLVNQDDQVVQRGRKALLLSKVPLEAISASAAVETRNRGEDL